MSLKTTLNVSTFTKLGSRGFAHYVAPLVVIVAIAIGGTFAIVASHAATPVQKKPVTLKVVIRKLPNCNAISNSAFFNIRPAKDTLDAPKYTPPSSKTTCVRVKSGGQTYSRATITFKFNQMSVYNKIGGSYPSYTYYFKYTLPRYNYHIGYEAYRLKFQNPAQASGYKILDFASPGGRDAGLQDNQGTLQSTEFKKFRSSYSINLEAYSY